jgi:hypothetical protein
MKPAFIEPMLLLRTEKLPEGPDWLVELKLDGYRALAIKTDGKVHLRSRNDNDFNARYPGIAKAKGEWKYKGRQPTARAKAEQVRALLAGGVGPSEVARQLGIGRSSVHRIATDRELVAGRERASCTDNEAERLAARVGTFSIAS